MTSQNEALLSNEETIKNLLILPISQQRAEFLTMMEMAKNAIRAGIYPSLIYEGSSGSYFVLNTSKRVIGIFKPKNEEPYGKLNPKWLKWCHRIFLPCCFGRSCIQPNKGYLSEAGAYLVDQFLELNIVPPTCVTLLVSPTFNYSALDRSTSEARKFLRDTFSALSGINIGLPSKIGSLQQFMEGYTNAYVYLQRFESEQLPPEADEEFQFMIEKLIVLDYVTRNTDRGNNWLIKMDNSTEPHYQDGILTERNVYKFYLAAIDNGLAFPFKHPDSWRSYPFDWAYIHYAKRPFSDRIKKLILPKLTDTAYIETMVSELEELFSIDKGYDVIRFHDQMSVMRGQIYNLVKAFSHDDMTPESLIRLAPIYIVKSDETMTQYKQLLHVKRPFFKSF